MSAFISLFGEDLVSQGNTTVKTAEALDGKFVGIYFSAHWCPPCRNFTPVLAESYSKHLSAKNFEIVFVSSDKDQSSFEGYFGEMPWKALPFADRTRKDALSKKFKVDGIPTFVVLDANGSVIVKDGRTSVSNDPTGLEFPWRAKTFSELIGTSFVGSHGATTLDESAIAGKVIGLYFSAHWCPPCRGFTPTLAKWYLKMKEIGLPFEIVFASSDRNEADFKTYFDEMPWLALPYSDRARKDKLSAHFGVNGIPSLVIIDANGKTITTSGREIPEKDTEGSEFPWYPKPVKELGAELTDGPAFIVFAEASSPDDKAQVLQFYTKFAQAHIDAANAKDEEPELRFFFVWKPAELSGRVRGLCDSSLAIQAHEHPLKIADFNKGFGCDWCRKTFATPEEAVRYRCSETCDFDYCGKCVYLLEGEKDVSSMSVADLKNELLLCGSEDGESSEDPQELAAKYKKLFPKTKTTPLMFVLDFSEGQFYEPELQEVTEESVKNFTAAFLQGSLTPKPFVTD